MSKFNALAICLTLACALAISARATTITVTNTNDSGPGSLRQALVDASDGDIIDATGVSGVITLTSGELLVDKSVTINGASADVLTVDGNARSVVFHITATGSVAISDLTIRNGQSDFGGGILNEEGATLTVTNSVLSGNSAGYGGGVDNRDGTVTITNSTLDGNMAAHGGGAFSAGTLTIVNSTVSGNTAAADGGGTSNDDTLTITNSTFSGNLSGEFGGACMNVGTMRIVNSTLSGNSALSFGAGVMNSSMLQIGNTILKRGTSGANIDSTGTVTSLGYNVCSDNGGGVLTGPGDQINTDPLLGPLQDNGGPTFTHALLPNSPAIDAGDPSFASPPFFDQRGPGFDRVVNGRVDIGSFEVQPALVPQSALSQKTHGAAGIFDVPLPLTGDVGIECRSGGATNDYQMIVNFANPVTVQSASMTSGTGTVSSFSVSGPQVTVNLTGVTNAQRITVTLVNVNDGIHMGNVPVSMGVLIGDTNANATVNAADVAQTKARLGQTVDATNFRSDVNTNGSINAADTAIVKQNSGTSLPP